MNPCCKQGCDRPATIVAHFKIGDGWEPRWACDQHVELLLGGVNMNRIPVLPAWTLPDTFPPEWQAP